jgi:hypothetical protein
MSGGYSAKELLMWIGGTLVAVMIVIFGVIMVVDTYLAFRDPSDPIEQQRRLSQEPTQEPTQEQSR